MQSTFKKLGGSKIALEVILPQAEFQPHWDRYYEEAIARVSLKGFRPGSAPRELAAKAVDPEKVFEAALQETVRTTLGALSEEHSWTVIERPQIELVSATDPTNPKSTLVYKAELTIFPEIKLSDYKKIAKKILFEKKTIEVTEKEVNESLEWLRKSRAITLRVTREAKISDVVELDVETTHDGKVIPGGKLKNDKFELGVGKYIPGFEEQIVGHKEGEHLDFELTVPKDYWQTDLREKQLHFSVTVNSVFELQLPEANDDFAKSLGKFTSLNELKKSIASGLTSEKEYKETDRLRVKMLDAITTDATIDLPAIFIEKTLDGMVEEVRAGIEARGTLLDEARKTLRPNAEKRVKANLIVHEIAKLESLEPTKEEVEEESRHHAREGQGIAAEKLYDYIYGIVLNKKVFALLEKI